MNTRPRLLVISHVLPFPGSSGQQQRVANSLRALRGRFHLTFLTYATAMQTTDWQTQLAPFCDEALLLPSLTADNYWHKSKARVYAALNGLKPSNYLIGQVEFSPARLSEWLKGKHFDLALYEYFHAAPSVPMLRARGIPCVLDMHDILWQTYKRELSPQGELSEANAKKLARYREQEESAWLAFDGLIAINQDELRYVESKARAEQKRFHAAMGVNLSDWPYGWQPVNPPRLAYYGGLGNHHNQAGALACVKEIMPRVWQRFPDAELWMIGSHPPAHLTELAAQDQRLHVTGFVADVANTLKHVTALLCPWEGTFGFRSRLIEAMAVGVPVIATPDAVYGMDMTNEQGLWLGETTEELATHALRFLQDPAFAAQQSRAARQQVEKQFSFATTYERLANELAEWLSNFKHERDA